MLKEEKMFELESREYANKWLRYVKDLELQYKTDDKPEYIRIEEAYQKGAEFGFQECAKSRLNVTSISDCPIKEDDKLQQAMKQIHNLLYVYQLGKNELATARIRAEAERFLKDNNYFN